ncbi:helix-turn-helix transcriptional regulator [Paenibacillus larvae]|uniref:helix-turn-helix transcriptional regulator n=1 Tax=Paenibacillus larvae TaxID=1464 RepID=UPI002853FF27|nr:helix-turn-helix transcriptional regulator [Paenibacillus larvae]MDR5600278.1 helix-turn-helix transcriptional regulator [Paenibacillus larvae]
MNNLEKKQMGLRIKKLREEKGLTQEELAEILKMKNRATVSSYEAGRSTPPSDVLRNLADIFNVSADYLLGRGGNDEFVTPPEDNQGGAVSEIGWAIKLERQSQDMTQKELGKQVGENQRQISSYELDLKPVPEHTLDKIMEVFGLSFPEFLAKYNMWDESIHPHFDGDANKQIAFEKAQERDALNDSYKEDIQTIAAHHDGEEWTEEELETLGKFKQFVLSQRKNRS